MQQASCQKREERTGVDGVRASLAAGEDEEGGRVCEGEIDAAGTFQQMNKE